MPDARITYQEWGEDFFAAAISEERLLGAVNELAGQPIDVGPIGVGPGRIAKVRAYGGIGAAEATRAGDRPITFRVQLPAQITFEVDLGVEVQRFHAEVSIPLVLSALALDGVRIFVDITPPEPDAIAVRVRGENLRSELLKRVANIEGELRRFVAGYLVRELDKPQVQAARMIDVGAMIDRAWSTLKPPPAPPEGVVADLTDALEREVSAQEDLFLDTPDR